jgi:hypothetical protein
MPGGGEKGCQEKAERRVIRGRRGRGGEGGKEDDKGAQRDARRGRKAEGEVKEAGGLGLSVLSLRVEPRQGLRPPGPACYPARSRRG